MFRIIVSLLLILNIATAQAQIVSHQSLKDLVDQLQFSLTVEWDQKDLNFRNEKLKAFNEGLANLRKQGLTDRELLDFIKSEVKDQKVSKDIDELYSMLLKKNVSSQLLESKFLDLAKKTQNRGASWSIEDLPLAGQIGVFVGTLAALYGIIFLMVYASNNYGGSGGGGGGGGGSGGGSDPYCYEEKTCSSYYSTIWDQWVEDCTYQTICY